MDLNLEACMGLSPLEVVPIVFSELVESGAVRIQDYADDRYIVGLMNYCIPQVTKKSSEQLIKKLKLEDQLHPHFFYRIQQQYNKQIFDQFGIDLPR